MDLKNKISSCLDLNLLYKVIFHLELDTVSSDIQDVQNFSFIETIFSSFFKLP